LAGSLNAPAWTKKVFSIGAAAVGAEVAGIAVAAGIAAGLAAAVAATAVLGGGSMLLTSTSAVPLRSMSSLAAAV